MQALGFEIRRVRKAPVGPISSIPGTGRGERISISFNYS